MALIESSFCASDRDLKLSRVTLHSADRLQLQASRLSSDPEDISWALVLSALQNAEAGRAIQARKALDQALQSKLDRNRRMTLALSLARSGRTEEAEAARRRSQPGSTIGHYCAEVSCSHSPRRDQVAEARSQRRHRSSPRDRPVRPRSHPVVRLSLPGLHPWTGLPGVRRWPISRGRVPKADRQSRLCWENVTGPLARLQLGRAQRLMGDNASRPQVLRRIPWPFGKNADPDLPVYQQAKAEYAKLRK